MRHRHLFIGLCSLFPQVFPCNRDSAGQVCQTCAKRKSGTQAAGAPLAGRWEFPSDLLCLVGVPRRLGLGSSAPAASFLPGNAGTARGTTGGYPSGHHTGIHRSRCCCWASRLLLGLLGVQLPGGRTIVPFGRSYSPFWRQK
ncbi:hypothetical protein B0T13DRAFT_41486 [Neurospora crassa]|nr:hypothetical protein B0T13DRAFT_41486 [Neurospora crassa]